MRASNIDKHTNVGYDIFSGEDRKIMQRRMENEVEPNIYQQNINAIKEMEGYRNSKRMPGQYDVYTPEVQEEIKGQEPPYNEDPR